MKHWMINRLGGATLAVTMGFFGGAVQAQDLNLASSLPSWEFPFFLHMQQQIEAEVAAQGGIELLAMDGQNQTPTQTANVEAAIVKGVDGLIISPIDSVAMAPVLAQAVEAGIPVITIDRRVDGVDGILAHIGADNVKGGEAQGNLIAAMFPDGATIVVLKGRDGASPAIDRFQGLHNALDPMGDKYSFVAEQTANWGREEGASVTEAIIAGLGEPPDVIVAANDDMALGAMQVAQNQNLDIAIIGFDALPEALAAVRDGGLAATIEQLPGAQSRAAVEAMVAYLRAGTVPEKLVLLTPIAITKDNINDAERLSELN
jgi:inositol transport system substrate-binding protein